MSEDTHSFIVSETPTYCVGYSLAGLHLVDMRQLKLKDKDVVIVRSPSFKPTICYAMKLPVKESKRHHAMLDIATRRALSHGCEQKCNIGDIVTIKKLENIRPALSINVYPYDQFFEDKLKKPENIEKIKKELVGRTVYFGDHVLLDLGGVERFYAEIGGHTPDTGAVEIFPQTEITIISPYAFKS